MTIKRLPLVLGMLFGLFAGAQAQGVYVCGHKLTSGTTYNSFSGIGLKSGTIKFEANGNSEASVVFEGVEINAASSLDDYAFHTTYNHMTITLIGTNKVTAKNSQNALLLSGTDMTVDGIGSLEIEATKTGIDRSGTLRIKDAHIKVKGGTYGINSTSPLFMSGNAMLEAYGETASIRANEFSGTGFGIKIPYEAKYERGYFVDEDGKTIKGQWVVIARGASVNKTNFPDDIFRSWVISQDYGADHFLDQDEIDARKKINVSGLGIKKLNGIKFFTALQDLRCNNNELSVLDLSSNVQLKYLDCSYNQLYSLLSYECFIIKNCPKLDYLNCQNNKLRYLDISGNTRLTTLYCANNNLTSLDVKNNTYLSKLSIYGNKIAVGMQDLINDMPKYKKKSPREDFVDVPDGNELISEPTFDGIDDPGWWDDEPEEPVITPIFTVVCSQAEQDNEITPAQIKSAEDKGWRVMRWNGTEGKDITYVEINETNFPDENFRNFLLEQDYGKDGFLMDTELATVTDLDLTTMNIRKLDGIGFFTDLTRLICQANILNKLDVTKNTKLTILNCSMNGLSELDLSHNTALTALACSNNSLSTLDFSHNTALTSVSCEGNRIRGDGMATLVNSLPASEGGVLYVIDDHNSNDNTITTAQAKIAMDKGWTVKKFNDAWQPEEYAGFDPIAIDETNFPSANFRDFVKAKAINTDEDDYLSEREVKAVTVMDLIGKGISNLKGIEYFTALQELSCYGNDISTLDFSKNTALTKLICGNHSLTSLNVSANTALTKLDCSASNLTSLDVSNNTALKELVCYNNSLTSLDVSANTALEILRCEYNSLTSLKVSTTNTALTFVCCYGNQISGTAMTNLVNGLPSVTGDSGFNVCDDTHTPDNVITAAQVKIATDKGWMVLKFNGSYAAQYAGYGDVTGDNKINQNDLDLTVNIIMGQKPDTVGEYAGDLNKDGKTDAADIVLMNNILKVNNVQQQIDNLQELNNNNKLQ